MSVLWYLGIDDTDNETSIGTGRLARMLAAHLVEAGALSGAPSVTRHQLLVHPDVPYTSHNSSACIAAHGDAAADAKLLDLARAFVMANEHEGANPGLCLCRADAVPGALSGIGRRAQNEVLALADFDAALATLPVALWSQGETGQGRIGAASGVGLRRTGEDGRFIELRGIRALRGAMTVGEVLAASDVEDVVDEAGASLPRETVIETGDWVRPALVGGRAVHRVRCQGDRFVGAERKKKEDDG